MKILIVSHPRSGTGFAAMCLQDIGIKVGHESLMENGISSWLWAADCYTNARWGDNYQDIKPDLTVLLARDAEDVIASMAFTAARALDWMRQWVQIPDGDSPYVCAHSLVRWIELCQKNRKPDFIVRTKDFPDFCEWAFGQRPSENLRGYNARPHKPLSARSLKKAAPLISEYNELIKNYWRKSNN